MTKPALSFLLSLTVTLAACAPAVTPTPASVPATTPEAPAPATPTAAGYATSTPIAVSGPELDPRSLFPPVGPDDLVMGPPTAKVTIIEYSDFQCPYCARLAPILNKLKQAYPDDVRVVYRHFPLSFHDKAFIAAEAAEAANAQGKFAEWHDVLFYNFADWAEIPVANIRPKFTAYAQQIGLDVARFNADLDNGTYRQKVSAALEFATTVGGQGLPGTPFVLFNGEPLQTQLEFWIFDALVKLELLKARQFKAPEQVIDPLKNYSAVLVTEKGEVEIELFAEAAPQTVNSFVFLAQQGWFDGVTFHRVIPGFVAQTGDPTGTGIGGPGYVFPNEISPNLKYDSAGVVGMANSGADTNGSQFFITYGPASNLDGKYTIFGRVVRGLEVVQALTPRDPSRTPEAAPGDRILTVQIVER